MHTNGKKKPALARRIIGDILIFLMAVLTVETIIVMTHKINTVVLKDDYISVFRYELIFCAIFLIFALDVRFGFFTKLRFKAAKVIGWILRIIIVLLTAVLGFFCIKVVIGSCINTSEKTDYAIVLGLALENGQPTRSLLLRLDTGQKYLEQYPEAKLILTGGNADDSGKTEAEAMRELLVEKGVPDASMILEDEAKTTKENFLNVAAMIDPAAPVVFISSGYHMERAVMYADKAGFTNIRRLPAPSPFFEYGADMMSEVVLFINEITKG